jgi:hypothetical protein
MQLTHQKTKFILGIIIGNIVGFGFIALVMTWIGISKDCLFIAAGGCIINITANIYIALRRK